MKRTDTLVVWGSLFPPTLNVVFILTVDFVFFQLAVKIIYCTCTQFKWIPFIVCCFTVETMWNIALHTVEHGLINYRKWYCGVCDCVRTCLLQKGEVKHALRTGFLTKETPIVGDRIVSRIFKSLFWCALTYAGKWGVTSTLHVNRACLCYSIRPSEQTLLSKSTYRRWLPLD